MKITASRLSEGNKVFPAEIHTEPNGVTVKIPGLFSGESKFFDYHHIASVDVEAPMVGYSTITFYAGGTRISAHGFTSGEVKQIKQEIEQGKANNPVSTYGGNGNVNQSNQAKDSVGTLLVKFLFWPIYLIIKLTPKFFSFITSERVTSAVKGGVTQAATANARKNALTLHNDLVKATDDIDIALAQGKKDEALVLIKKLDHSSTHQVPNENVSYSEYWNAKRKEYIGKIS